MNPKFLVKNNGLELPWDYFSEMGLNFVGTLEATVRTSEVLVSIWDIRLPSQHDFAATLRFSFSCTLAVI